MLLAMQNYDGINSGHLRLTAHALLNVQHKTKSIKLDSVEAAATELY